MLQQMEWEDDSHCDDVNAVQLAEGITFTGAVEDLPPQPQDGQLSDEYFTAISSCEENDAPTSPSSCNSTKRQTKAVYCALCPRRVVALNRHLREYHHLTDVYVKLHGQRLGADRPLIDARLVQKRPLFTMCPIYGCPSVVRRMDKHLKSGRHGMTISDPMYTTAISLSKKPQYAIHDKLLDEGNGDNTSDGNTTTSDDETDVTKHYSNSDNDEGSASEDSTADKTERHDTGVKLSEHILAEVKTFCDWLQSFGGGGKSAACAKATRLKLFTVLSWFGDDFSQNAVAAGMERLEAQFIPNMLKKRQASTVRGHFDDFKRWISWACIKRKVWMDAQTAESIRSQIQIWNVHLGKLISRRRHEKREYDKRDVLTVAELKMYGDGERAMESQRILRSYCKRWAEEEDQPPVASKDVFLRTRNHLILKILLSNATRAGPIITVSVEEVRQATRNLHNDRHVVTVWKHKTSLRYGAAKISLSGQDFNQLVAYIEYIRPSCPPGDSHDVVFTNYYGRPLTQSHVASIVTQELSWAVGRDLKASCTLLRKSIVSIILDLNVGARNEGDLAALMSHSEKTQKSYYDVRATEKKISRVSRLLSHVVASGQEACDMSSDTGSADAMTGAGDSPHSYDSHDPSRPSLSGSSIESVAAKTPPPIIRNKVLFALPAPVKRQEQLANDNLWKRQVPNVDVEPLVCTKCGKRLMNLAGLASHLRFKHGVRKMKIKRTNKLQQPV